MLELLSSPDAWASLAVLTAMEIVLGIDNIVFITILAGRLPQDKQLFARRIGIAVALISRICLLLAITWVMRLTEPLFTLVREWSGKDLILLGGGLFLIWKATSEIYENVEHPEGHAPPDTGRGARPASAAGVRRLMFSIIGQVIVLDLVFSLDSVITAVGMAEHVEVMVAAILIAVGVMLAFAGPIGDFVQDHPSIRVLALAFLVLVGVVLIMEGTGQHVPKGYIYFSMAFALAMELLNMRRRAKLARVDGAPG